MPLAAGYGLLLAMPFITLVPDGAKVSLCKLAWHEKRVLTGYSSDATVVLSLCAGLLSL